MFNFSKRSKLPFDLSAAIAATLIAVLYWYDFFENNNEWKWLGGIVFGTIAVMKMVDLVNDLKERKNLSRDRATGQN